MNKFVIFITMLFLLFTGASCGRLSGNDTDNQDGVSKATENRYGVAEIKEYQGINLDPSVGPRDNSIKGIQTIDISSYHLKIQGLVQNSVSLTYNEILDMQPYEKLVILHCVEGWDATILWKGVLIGDLISLAGVESKADTVIFHCVDGYTTFLPLDTIVNQKIILAYSSNGITLPAELGYPFIVVAEDKLGYKWARWVDSIELSDGSQASGYWENRGYDSGADVPDSWK